MRWLAIIFLLLWVTPVQAQVGTCEPDYAEAFIKVGNVHTRILNNGKLFRHFGPYTTNTFYKIGGANAINSANIWIAGKVNQELRLAATTLGPQAFWPGPLDAQKNPTLNCKAFNKIWEITRQDIETFLSNRHITDNLKNWPWQLGAPVIDGDGIPENYNLAGGDLPALLGDQRLWWIMNDRGNLQETTGAKSPGVEVHATSFALKNPSIPGNLTFYEYNVINKNREAIEDTYVSLFMYPDLGNYDDDFIGADSLLHLAFVYNGDNDDEGEQGYGIAPPALGVTFFETLLADNDGLDNNRNGLVDEPREKMGASSVMNFFSGGSVTGDPVFPGDYYNYMRAHWKDGKPLIEGGSGRFGFPPYKKTRFFYPGDPVTASYWSERNVDNEGYINHPSDRKFIISTGPFTLLPADTATVRFAIIWSRGEDYLDSVAKLKSHTRAVRILADQLYTPIRVEAEPIPPLQHILGFDQNFPNPFTQATTFRYSLPQSMQVRLAVYDLLGREVALLVDAQQEAGIHTAAFDAGDLPAGVYLARIELDFLQFTKRMVLLK